MSVNVEYNGKSVPVANIGIVSSKEKILLGNLERDLVLQTLGSITVQVGNKFYDLPFSLNGNTATLGLNIKNITSLDGINLSNYSNGTFLFNTLNNALYLIYNGQLITISGASDNNKMFLSYVNEQSLNGSQKERLVLNAGMYVNSINDVKFFTENDVYENMIIFCKDEQTHYVLSNFYKPNSIESWTTFYIGLNGGTIKNGLIIQNKTRENLLFLNGINDFNPTVFNGLKIGSNDSWMKTSVDIDNKSTINYNTKDFLIKSGLSPVLHVSEKNIGIGGYASGSDSYNILLTGTVKLNDPLYTDKKIVSTDYTTTNITHWDGGKGFGLTHGSDNKWFFEVDDLLVRGSIIANKMILKELEVERAYATGGHMLVTDGAVVNSYSYRFPTAEEVQAANITYNGDYGTLDPASYYYFVTFKETTEKDNDDAYVSLPPDPATVSANSDTNNIEKDTLDVDKNCPFIAGDVLLCQTASGLTAKKYYCLVSYSTNKYIAIKSNNFRNNAIYQRDNEGNPISIVKDFSIESNDALIRITNILVDNQSIYKYKERRRFIDIDGTRNQITMYDNLGTPNLFTEELNSSGFYDEINIITGIGPSGSLKLRMGELSDLGIAGLTGYGLYADNVYLKGKLIVKNDDIETELGANRGLWVLNNTNTYYLNDMISYNGSAYRCVVKHTNTVESNAIPGISSFWEIWVQKGNDGVAGTSFKYVDISGEQVFVYDQELDSFDKTSIPLSCTAFNVDYANLINIKFEWSIGGTTIKSKTYLKAEVLSGTIIDSINIYPRGINETINWDNYWVENKSISITCKVYTNDSLVYDSDVFSVYKVKNGEDSYTVLLSNEAMTVPCLPDGSFPSNIFSSPYKYQTQLQVYNGITKLIYGQDYTIAFTNGLISLVNSSTIGQDYGLLSVSGFSTTDLTIDSGSINITVNILRDSVIFLSFIKTISISKAKQGPLLDWIKEWDQNSTVVGADKIISPRIFTGTNDVNGITGVTLGRNAFGLTEVGIGGYYHSQPTFSLNTNGEFIIGAKNQSIVYQTTTYTAGTNYLSFSLANGLEISADVKFKDPNGSYTLSGYVSNNTPKIYRDAYSVTVNKSNFAPTGIKDKDLWYPLSYDSGSIAYSGYFFIYDSLQTGDKWVVAGDNTLTTINGGIITSGTIQLGASGTTNSGITGLTSVGDTNPVRFWAGDTFVNRNIADFKVHENGLVEIGNTNTSYALDANGLLTTGTGLILYTDPTTHAGGLSTKKIGIKPDGNVYIDGSVLVSNIAGSSENIALSQLLSYFVLKTVNGTNYLSTPYTISSEKELIAYGAGTPGTGGGSGLISSVLGSAGLGGSYLDSDLTNTFNAYTINLINGKLTSALGRIGALETSTPNVAWGTPTSQYSPLTINSATRNLSLDGHTHSYLPLSGGTLSGWLFVNQYFKLNEPTNGFEIFQLDGNGDVGFNLNSNTRTFTINQQNTVTFAQDIKVGNNNLVYHSGNFTPSSYLPLSGGTLIYGGKIEGNGNITIRQISNGGNATGLWWKNIADTENIAGIGAMTTNGEIETLYLGWGTSPWLTSNSLSVSSIGLTYKNNTVWHAGNFNPSAYLPLSGGTMTGILTVRPSNISGIQDGIILDDSGGGLGECLKIIWKSASYTTGKSLYASPYGDLVYDGNTVWHAGNDGAGSGLDADTLDGLHDTSFFKTRTGYRANINDQALVVDNSTGHWGSDTIGRPSAEYGTLMNISDSNTWYNQLGFGTNYNIYFRQSINSPTGFGAWKTFAFTDSNVASATKLANTRTIWGQNFNGEGNVDGILTVTNTGNPIINLNSTFNTINNRNWDILTNVNTWGNFDIRVSASYNTAPSISVFTIKNNGNVGIGTTTDTGYKLDVNGTGRFSGAVSVNSILLPANASIHFGTTWNTGVLSFSNGVTEAIVIDVPGGKIQNNLGKYLIASSSVGQFGTQDNYGLALVTNNTEKLRIDTNGNVGIGTASPSYKLDVNGSFRSVGAAYLNSTLSVTGTSTLTGLLTANGGIGSTTGIFSDKIISGTAKGFRNAGFQAGFNAIWSFNNSETYGIGYYQGEHGLSGVLGDVIGFHFGNTASPNAKIDSTGGITSSSYITSNRFYAGYDSGVANSFSCSNWFRSSGATGWLNATYGGGITMEDATYVKVSHNKSFWVNGNIVATGEVTAYAASDRRLKENIRPIISALDVIEKLNPVTYNWNSVARGLNPLKGNDRDFGLIAQELETIIPELVHSIYGGQYKSIDYVKIVPLLIGAIKELQLEINKLKNK